VALPERFLKAAALKGSTEPRLAPPVPAKSLLREYEAAAKELGIRLMPWQRFAARYATGRSRSQPGGPFDRWAFREFAALGARQNGKTTLLLPLIKMRLKAGRKILHTAQNRSLPRETFLELAVRLQGDPSVVEIRYANGQEIIKCANGGRYTLVAPTKSGARGHGVDDVILDEVREQDTFELIASIKPALTASKDPQIIYLSNAGDDTSVVLNDLRRRRDSDPALAYLEWSARGDRALDDHDGWAEANGALGITIQLETLEDFYRSLPATVFETEHLCRWVPTMQPRLVGDVAWQRCRVPVEQHRRPTLAISMDASGTRASAAIAWHQSDGTVGLRIIADVIGNPIDVNLLGPELRQAALRLGVTSAAFDPWTDSDLARHLKIAKPLGGRDYANASENFVRVIESGRLRWDDADQVTADLAWTARKPHESGAWQAVKAKEDRPVTAAFAAIRAVWLASGPKPQLPKVM
jgi:hypothetical protein